MPTKRFKPEQIVNLLPKIEVEIANGRKAAQAAWEAGICDQTYYRRRKEFGGLKLDQAKRLVAELSLEKQVLRDAVQGSFQAPSGDVVR